MTASGFLKRIGIARLIILGVLILLLMTAAATGMDWVGMTSDIIRRWGQFGILTLAMVPGIQCGIGLNFGVTLGVVGGLLGALLSIEFTRDGALLAMGLSPGAAAVTTLAIAVVLGAAIAAIIGIGYGFLLNRVKGAEMTVSTYIGFSSIAAMNIVWLSLPFKSGELLLPMRGRGLKGVIPLDSTIRNVLNDFMYFEIPIGSSSRLSIPTGLLLFFFVLCFLVWLFLRSKTGIAMSAAGSNPAFARANGIDVDKMRILGTSIATSLGGVGIIVYAQSYGFLQLYNAPMMMSFTAVASVLIGGAGLRRSRVSDVIWGTFLFQGMLTLGLPVANNIIPITGLSEVLRMIISNGIILFALTRTGGGRSG